jgi:hypothetical protein
MRYGKLLMCLVPLAVLAACDDDGITDNPPPGPAAAVRFVNTGTDMGMVDLRFVDILENLPTLQGVAFRSASGMYQRAEAGARMARVFPNSTHPDTTSIFLIDETINLAANTRYTLLYTGRANAAAGSPERHRLAVLEDPRLEQLPSPATGNIAVQALHAAVGVGNVDVYVVPVATTTADTPADWATNNAGVLSNIAYLGRAGAYLTVPARTGTTFYRFVVTNAGTQTVLFAATPNQPGAAATVAAGPQPGVRISGSVMTAVIAPGSTPGTRGSVAANQTPTVFLIPDKVLNQ